MSPRIRCPGSTNGRSISSSVEGDESDICVLTWEGDFKDEIK
jgi:hypothetical protein